MKNLFSLLLACFVGISANAQLNCNTVNTSISTSISGGTVTLTNNSTPTATSNIYTSYTIDWGDNNVTWSSSNTSQTHTYHTSGTYTINLYSNVLDSINNINCYDTATTTVSITTSLNCNNITSLFYTYRSGNTGLVLQNRCTPNAGPNLGVQYHINWGDGNTTTTTSKNNQTHTYNLGGNYNVTMYLTVTDSNNSITCHDTLTKTVNIPGANALDCDSVNVLFWKGANLGTFTLYNASMPVLGGGISATYLIDWGDGSSTTVSNRNNQSHTYSASGTYIVKLKATYSSSTLTCVDSTSDTVNISLTPPNFIQGTIYTDSNTNNIRDTFKVWLITHNQQTNILAAIDSQIVYGYNYIPYIFNNITGGIYRVKAHQLNGPSTGIGLAPTYHDSSLLWNNADTIAHTGGPTSGKNIYMKTGTVTTGPGFVGGNVLQGANKGTANGIANMNVFVLNSNGQLIQSTITDPSGKYTFSNLPIGSYKIYPENLGDMTTPAVIVISNSKQTLTDISFERSNKNKTIKPKPTGISTNSFDESNYSIYPNPAKNELHVDFDERVDNITHITLTDVTGKVINTIQAQNKNTLNISKLSRGLYLINIKANNISFTQKVVIQ